MALRPAHFDRGFVAGHGISEGMLYGSSAPHDGAAVIELDGTPEFRGTAVLAGKGVWHRLRLDVGNVPISHGGTPVQGNNTPARLWLQLSSFLAKDHSAPALLGTDYCVLAGFTLSTAVVDLSCCLLVIFNVGFYHGSACLEGSPLKKGGSDQTEERQFR
jgi:hypothetical protein